MSINHDPDHAMSVLLHGFPGAGKTPVALTVPGPALVLDVEGRTRFVQRPKVAWNPLLEAPPEPDGSFELCVVQCRDWPTFLAAMEYLVTGQHEFRSVVLDSATELQKRAKDKILGQGSDEALAQREWGTLLAAMEGQLRSLRDTTTHPTQPVQCVVVTAITEQQKDGRWGPYLQGSISKSLPGLVDVIAYLYVDDDDEAGTSSKQARRMLVSPSPTYVSKDATSELPGGGVSGRFGAIVSGPIDWGKILETIFK